jgi:hypothetical protein
MFFKAGRNDFTPQQNIIAISANAAIMYYRSNYRLYWFKMREALIADALFAAADF